MRIYRLLGNFLLSLFLVIFVATPVLFAANFRMPVPSQTSKINERSSEFGPVKMSTSMYKTFLGEGEIYDFYEEKLSQTGWSVAGKGVFSKDKHLATIQFYPSGNPEKESKFSITIGNTPDKEEFLSMSKKKPDRVSFMPVYPGSIQTISLKFLGKISFVYETDDSVKDVVFFYESAMLKYGWELAARNPVTGISKNTVLLFRRKENKENCKIKVSENLNAKFSSDLIPLKKTSISVDYNAYKKSGS